MAALVDVKPPCAAPPLASAEERQHRPYERDVEPGGLDAEHGRDFAARAAIHALGPIHEEQPNPEITMRGRQCLSSRGRHWPKT